MLLFKGRLKKKKRQVLGETQSSVGGEGGDGGRMKEERVTGLWR